MWVTITAIDTTIWNGAGYLTQRAYDVCQSDKVIEGESVYIVGQDEKSWTYYVDIMSSVYRQATSSGFKVFRNIEDLFDFI